MASTRSGGAEPPVEAQFQQGATGGGKSSHGAVARAVAWLDENQSAFVVARLIMMTGLKLRSYTRLSPDEPAILQKLDGALRAVLTPNDHRAIQRIMHEEIQP